MICFIAYLIPVCGQNDAITKDGLYLKYNTPYYGGSSSIKLTVEFLRDPNFRADPPNDSDMVRGELDRATKCTGLTYNPLPQYIISETFGLSSSPANPIELRITANNVITSQWIHEDGECILFIKCTGMKSRINKSIDEIPKSTFDWIKYTLGMGSFLTRITEEQMREVQKQISIWTPEKARETFNAQYVITYPIKNEKAVYMDRYMHKLELIMIKWGENLTVSFLVTEKGNENIDKYIKDVEGAFRFEY